jgi:RimJ/RimL family protein N-acetyltransferase
MQENDFKLKDNMCLGIFNKNSNKFLGEVVAHNFTYDGEVEIGVRLFKKYHGNGYGSEAVKLISSYVKNCLYKRPVAKCYKQNAPSLNSLKRAGFVVKNTDKTYYYLNFED